MIRERSKAKLISKLSSNLYASHYLPLQYFQTCRPPRFHASKQIQQLKDSTKKCNSIWLLLLKGKCGENKEKRLFPIKLSNNSRSPPTPRSFGPRNKNMIVFIVFQTIGIMLRFLLCKYLAFFNFANSLRFDCGGGEFFDVLLCKPGVGGG